MGLEGIASKRKDSPYRSGRSRHSIKSKSPAASAVKREAEEDWGQTTMKPADNVPPIREWNDDDFDVLADGVVVGRIVKMHAALVGMPWMRTMLFLLTAGRRTDTK